MKYALDCSCDYVKKKARPYFLLDNNNYSVPNNKINPETKDYNNTQNLGLIGHSEKKQLNAQIRNKYICNYLDEQFEQKKNYNYNKEQYNNKPTINFLGKKTQRNSNNNKEEEKEKETKNFEKEYSKSYINFKNSSLLSSIQPTKQINLDINQNNTIMTIDEYKNKFNSSIQGFQNKTINIFPQMREQKQKTTIDIDDIISRRKALIQEYKRNKIFG